MNGPLSMSEAELLALEARHDQFIRDGRHIREHLRHCEFSDQQSVDGFDAMLAYIGILDEVKASPDITQPQAEMACHGDES